jgi:hypothetical protein
VVRILVGGSYFECRCDVGLDCMGGLRIKGERLELGHELWVLYSMREEIYWFLAK